MSEIQVEQPGKRRSKLLAGILGALVVAVCVQGAAMWYMHDKLSKVVASAKSDDEDWTVIPTPNKESAGKPDATQPGIGAFADPFGSGFDPGNWDPFQEMAQMRQQMDQLFNQSMGRFKDSPRFGNLAQPSTIVSSPNIDMTDEGDKYVIKIDMPGADQSDIQVEIKDQTLTVTGKRDQTVSQQKDGHVLRQERVSGQFRRSMPLPELVDESGMKSSYKDGVYTVILPKLPASKPGDTLTPQ
ncbi:MAG: Hsp20/alpha crystallin family protein [Candidatus Hydrogenedentales bacterium]|jgi:HSP20 family protein